MQQIDNDKLNALLGRMVDDFGARSSAALVIIGDRLGLYKAMAAPARSRPTELGERTAPPSATSASGSTRRPPAATSTTTRRPDATRCRPSRRSCSPTTQPGLRGPAAFEVAGGDVRRTIDKMHEALPRRRPASAGTSTTRACSTAPSASSAPATSPTSCRAGSRRSTACVEQAASAARASPTSAAATALRPSSWRRRIPQSTLLRLRLPRAVDRARAQARAGGRRRRSRDASRSPARRTIPAATTTWSPLRLPARHGRPDRRRARTCARRCAATAPG